MQLGIMDRKCKTSISLQNKSGTSNSTATPSEFTSLKAERRSPAAMCTIDIIIFYIFIYVNGRALISCWKEQTTGACAAVA
jgi:hypothetical protein